MEFTPIKVKIGLKAGFADYPDFNTLAIVKSAGMDWADYVDANGGGWHYDKQCGHADADVSAASVVGMQWGCLLVPPLFAAQAVAAFPDTVTEIDEATFATFHDERAHAHEPEEIINSGAMEDLTSRRALMVVRNIDTTNIDALIDKALDPTDSTAGVITSTSNTWAKRKASMGASIVKAAD